MLHYADDLAYIAQHANDQNAPSAGAMVGNIVWQGAKFQYGMDTLSMLRRGYRTGFYVPWTGGWDKNWAVKQFGLQGAVPKAMTGRGFQFSKRAVAGRYFEKAGLFGVQKATTKVATKYGMDIAKGAAAKFLIGRAAGIALGVVNPLLWGGLVLDATVGAYNWASAQERKYRGMELGGFFPETQGSYTSRQRAVQAITASHLQARSAIGNEAMLLHR
jgi:hypothetical protein